MRQTQQGAHLIDKTCRGCSTLLSAAVIKTIAKSNLGRKVFVPSYASRSWSIIERGQGELKKELKLRPWGNTVYWFASHWLSWLLYTAQDLLPWNGTTHSRLACLHQLAVVKIAHQRQSSTRDSLR